MFSEFIFFVLSVYEGWLLHTGTGAQPESIHRKDVLGSPTAGADGDERDRSDVVWQVRALAKAYAVVLHRWWLYVQAKQVLDVRRAPKEDSRSDTGRIGVGNETR
jgi:hypothetical protein